MSDTAMARSADHRVGGLAVPLAAADWTSFAPTPIFGVIGFLTVAADGGPINRLCSVTAGAWPLGGMATMYALMSAFHSAPWLKLLFKRYRPGSTPHA